MEDAEGLKLKNEIFEKLKETFLTLRGWWWMYVVDGNV